MQSKGLSSRTFCSVLQILIEAIENVGRCHRSDHIKKAISYVKILLEKQAEPNARDEWGSGTALHYAIWCGQLEVVKLLLDTGNCNIEADTGTAQNEHQLAACSAALFCFRQSALSASYAVTTLHFTVCSHDAVGFCRRCRYGLAC